MKHFRANHLPDEHLALVPERGYDSADSQSLLALKFIQYLNETEGLNIQHAHSPDGEKKIKNFRLDGWIEEGRIAIEVQFRIEL